jgi:DNA polymerase-3 subunit delta
MPAELSHGHLLKQIESGRLEPFYLFFGTGEFLRESALSKIRETCTDPATRDFNLRVFYGDKTGAGEMLDFARSLPFMAPRRVAIVRKAEAFASGTFEGLIPYLNDPLPTTCMIFIASSPDFRKSFFKLIRDKGRSVHFRDPSEKRIPEWIARTARDLGFEIDAEACGCLREIVGADPMDLYPELEKLALRFAGSRVGVAEVRQSAVNSRSYTIFELTDSISSRRLDTALPVLRRFLEEEGRDGVRRVLGMISREIGLLWQCKAAAASGCGIEDITKKLKIHRYPAQKLLPRCRLWRPEELEKSIGLLHRVDADIKTGAAADIMLERVLIALCTGNFYDA